MTTVLLDDRRRLPEGALLRVALLGGLALVAAGIASWLLASGSSGTREPVAPDAAAQAAFLEKTGVQIVRVTVTGGGGMVDLRYRVVDKEKAAIVHDPTRRPEIVDERTGEVIGDPFMGMWMHAKYIKPGIVYYQLLVNRQGLVKSGELASVVLGGARLEHVPVE